MAGYYREKEMELIQGEPECLRWFKARAPNPDFAKGLFLYLHHATGNFMLGRWFTARGVFSPILQIGKDLRADFTQKVRDEYLAMVHPQAGQTVKTAAQKAKDNQDRETEELGPGRIERRAKILRDECHIKAPDTGSVFLPDKILAG